MLRQQYKLNKETIKPRIYQTYRAHQCGLCNSLGNLYGLPFRGLTSYEVSLLSILISAQRKEEVSILYHRCPLDLRLKLSVDNAIQNDFTSAIAIVFEKWLALDNAHDAGDPKLKSKIISWALNGIYPSAIYTLIDMGLETNLLDRFSDIQIQANNDEGKDPFYPTAIISSEVFAITATLTNNYVNKHKLASVGESYGTYIFLLDAFLDWPSDLEHGRYSPLIKYGKSIDDAFVLSIDGIVWMANQILKIKNKICYRVNQLQLYRYEDDLFELICLPIDEFMAKLEVLCDYGRDIVLPVKNARFEFKWDVPQKLGHPSC